MYLGRPPRRHSPPPLHLGSRGQLRRRALGRPHGANRHRSEVPRSILAAPFRYEITAGASRLESARRVRHFCCRSDHDETARRWKIRQQFVQGKSGGLHGVGVSAVNAVSEWMEVTIHRDGPSTSNGMRPVYRVLPLAKLAPVMIQGRPFHSSQIPFSPKSLNSNLSKSTPGEGNSVPECRAENHDSTDEAKNPQVEHHYEGGLSEFVRQLNERREIMHENVITSRRPKTLKRGP